MKQGHKYNTGYFGTDAEFYVGRLFRLARNPNGHLRPDLVSVNGRFKPKLSIEVKSGINGKVSLVGYQLHYGITCEQDYMDIFGEKLSSKDPNLDILENFNVFSHSSKVAYYYNLVSRTRDVRSSDLNGPYSRIKLIWGNQVVVPHEVAFWSFAIARHLRTLHEVDSYGGSPNERERAHITDIVDSLKKQMQLNIKEGRSNYFNHKGKQDWQNMYARDMVALSERDANITTSGGVERIRLLMKYCPGVCDLEKILLAGPNNTEIRILANPEHRELFDYQLRNTVAERKSAIETVIRSRINSRRLLSKIKAAHLPNSGLYGVNGAVEGYDCSRLKRVERDRLNRLVVWAPRGEPLELDPPIEKGEAYEGDLVDIKKPKDDIAF